MKMKAKLIRIVRIETRELDPPVGISRLMAVLEEIAPSLTRKKSVDIYVDDNALKELLNIFELYKVPLKHIRNGIEVDIRGKMKEEGKR